MLVLAGAFEFAQNEHVTIGKEQALALVRSLEAMGYVAGQLAPLEAEMLAAYGIEPPPGWVVAGDKPQTRTLVLDDGHRVALVYFPMLGKKNDVADERTIRAVQRACKEAKQDHDLVIGLSPWGMWAEKAWLENDPKGPDILLGAGRGVEMQGTPMDKGGLYWVRAYLKGKSVNRIDLYAWPERGSQWTWQEDQNITGQFGTLRDNIPEDPTVLEILSNVQGH